MSAPIPTPAMGTALAQAPDGVAAHGPNGHAVDRNCTAVIAVITPRLLGVEGAARFLGVGAEVVKGLLESGELVAVRVPRPQTMREHRRGRQSAQIRRTLLDVQDLHRLVERWKAA